MGLPSPTVVSDEFRQWSIVVWNTFPLLMLVIVAAGNRVLDAAIPPTPAPKLQQAHLRVVRWLGFVSIAVGFALHVSVASLSASTVLFPTLFNEKYGRQITPSTLGGVPLSLASGKTVGDGIRGFMYWDQVVGYSLVLLVFLAQLRNAIRVSNLELLGWKTLVAASTLFSLLFGPGTAVLAVSWLRDEVLFGQVATEEGELKKR
jgi:hypothetical protein